MTACKSVSEAWSLLNETSPMFPLVFLVHSFSSFRPLLVGNFVVAVLKMLPVLHIVVIAYFVLYTLAYSIPYHFAPTQAFLREDLHLEKPEFGPQSSLDAWIREEEKIALDRLLRNIAPGGSNTQGAVPGTVIASPSKEHPDYYYQCERRLTNFCAQRKY